MKELPMKKLLIIFAISLVVLVSGGLGISILISKVKNYTVSDVRIVEPLRTSDSYLYTSKHNFQSIQDQKYYLTANSENLIQIGVFVDTDAGNIYPDVSSSDSSVANVFFSNSKCYVNLLRAGKATITASFEGLTDSFSVEVFDNSAEDVYVFDDRYYGEFLNDNVYLDKYKNQIVGYADDKDYSYRIETSLSKIQSLVDDDWSFSDRINISHIQIDKTQIDTDSIFDANHTYIDAKNKKLIVRCKSTITQNCDEYIPIQTYYTNSDGVTYPYKNFYVHIYIIAYTPEFLQIEVSSTPNFNNSVIYVSENLGTDDIDEKISNQNEIQTITLNQFNVTHNVYFTENVDKIYIRFRVVYTNGDIIYFVDDEVMKLNDVETDDTEIDFNVSSDNDTLRPWYDNLYYTISYDGNEESEIELSITNGFELDATFVFTYIDIDEENIDCLYEQDEETGVYTYTYWDKRAKFDDFEVVDNGDIIGFCF